MTFFIYAEKNTGERFVIFEPRIFNFSTNNKLNFIPNGRQEDNRIKNELQEYSISNLVNLNDANKKYFSVELPFVVCTNDIPLDQIPEELLEPNTPLNQRFNTWYNFQNTDWSVVCEIAFTTSYNDIETIITRKHTLIVEDFLENNEWSNEVIRSKDSSSNLLSSGDTLMILNDADTTIEVDYTYAGGGTAPNVNDIIFVGYIQPAQSNTNEGGHYASYSWICSDRVGFAGYLSGVYSGLKGINTSYLADITKDGNVYTVKFKTDYTKISSPSGGYRISGRIYNRAKFIAQYSDDEMIEFSDGTFMNFN
jgi:hypothetical protein